MKPSDLYARIAIGFIVFKQTKRDGDSMIIELGDDLFSMYENEPWGDLNSYTVKRMFGEDFPENDVTVVQKDDGNTGPAFKVKRALRES